MTSPEENVDVLRRLFDGVWNGSDPAVVDEFVSSDYLIHDKDLVARMRGPELYRTLAERAREFFPDVDYVFEDVVASGEKVALRWTMTGTHEGSIVGEEPTGREVALNAVEIDRFEGGSWRRRGPKVTCSGCWSRSG